MMLRRSGYMPPTNTLGNIVDTVIGDAEPSSHISYCQPFCEQSPNGRNNFDSQSNPAATFASRLTPLGLSVRDILSISPQPQMCRVYAPSVGSIANRIRVITSMTYEPPFWNWTITKNPGDSMGNHFVPIEFVSAISLGDQVSLPKPASVRTAGLVSMQPEPFLKGMGMAKVSAIRRFERTRAVRIEVHSESPNQIRGVTPRAVTSSAEAPCCPDCSTERAA